MRTVRNALPLINDEHLRGLMENIEYVGDLIGNIPVTYNVYHVWNGIFRNGTNPVEYHRTNGATVAMFKNNNG